MRLDPGRLSSDDVRRRFDNAAPTFDDADYVHRATCDGLIERLAPVAVTPGVVVDLGAATGRGGDTLHKQYPGAKIVSVDVSRQMLQIASRSRGLFSRYRPVAIQADARSLPLQSGCADLVFANLLLPWIDEPVDCFAEVARVLRKGGVFAFSTLGPDSLADLKEQLPVHDFPDMHDVGDALVRAGLSDPVLDVDRLRVTFRKAAGLVDDLFASGACSGDRDDLEAGIADAGEGQDWALNLELVFGHAWGVGPRTAGGEFHVDAGAIGRRSRP